MWQALEGNFESILANPYQIKTMQGLRRMHAIASGLTSFWRTD